MKATVNGAHSRFEGKGDKRKEVFYDAGDPIEVSAEEMKRFPGKFAPVSQEAATDTQARLAALQRENDALKEKLAGLEANSDPQPYTGPHQELLGERTHDEVAALSKKDLLDINGVGEQKADEILKSFS